MKTVRDNPMTEKHLLKPLVIGELKLRNRVFMAPMTRSRAVRPGDIPDEQTALYYAQRASAGLIISEGAPISATAKGYLFTPGLYSSEQLAGWRKVTSAVHAKGGRIAAQLWHDGRISHHSVLPPGFQPVAPSAIRADATVFALTETGEPGRVPVDEPHALTEQEIQNVIQEFVRAAANAIEAGFDMVELHGANGYLINQFLSPDSNTRNDRYGGSIEKRSLFTLEILDAVAAKIGAARIGLRLSPWSPQFINDIDGSVLAEETTLYLAHALEQRRIGYLHLAEWGPDVYPKGFREKLRKTYGGVIVVCGGYSQESANTLLASGVADAVAFGQAFIANPDLPERFALDAPLAQADQSVWFGGDERGYTDFPSMAESI